MANTTIKNSRSPTKRQREQGRHLFLSLYIICYNLTIVEQFEKYSKYHSLGSSHEVAGKAVGKPNAFFPVTDVL